MWVLDRANSPDLITRLREHARDSEFEVAWVGEGWRELVGQCHRALVAAFPEYELLAVKQKYGVLEYQAFPRAWARDERRWTGQEAAACHAITDEFKGRSETVCEWCGSVAVLRDARTLWLTLCDNCDARFPDPPYKIRGMAKPD